ncbi:N-acetylmuramoyl-L-alanine amidase [Peribacillus butanolivorans]|uniref:N-acetylmuramoyl-L-alanine amidase family protein n=1 Tax=Peribacillus butanolivorans TaxID=421767 RepID=UPI00207C2669|nr:N-acetylmuramoyl-L-alanine amidase [Peribacillus butanolivorans]MCO0597359.1 N-acetylmuramoyl-L-alanine amidase [Peribacillus butanolivorans]
MKIIIDAGHGPNTPGKRSPDGMREYTFNSRVADVMRDELEKYEGVTVIFTHADGTDVPLKDRTNKANKAGADVFISLHANANTGKMGDWGGIDTFVYKTNPKASRALADVVQRNLIEATGLRNRGVKTADFHVLRESKMTAILIEHGFMDSTTDLPLLKTDEYRVLCGKTDAKSVAEHYGLKLKKAEESKPEKLAAKPAAKPKAKGGIHRVIVDGKQVGAFSKADGIKSAVDAALKGGAKSIKIEEA